VLAAGLPLGALIALTLVAFGGAMLGGVRHILAWLRPHTLLALARLVLAVLLALLVHGEPPATGFEALFCKTPPRGGYYCPSLK
jgi:hypothetical protein